ncbi:acetyltransferase [Winogradskya consettensis]|uniref:acetyltransferase n=1 Tax=Winogradskya consettensis TaxID=113560 RepID=UPI001BB3F2DD|nr:acetyltransferase [Actinoplanes consettensis]
MTSVVIRPLVAGEENLFESMPDPLPQIRKMSYADGLELGGFRPSHTWVALRDGVVLARAAWVQPPGAVGEPWLERFDLAAEPALGADLLRAAHEALGGPKIYYAALPPYWRRVPQARAVVEPPMEAARLAGLVEGDERHRCTWAGTPLPEPSGRYTFRPAAGADEINDLVGKVAEPTLLTGSETALAVAGISLATDPQPWMGNGPSGWRIVLRHGEPVGLAGTSGDACFPQITYLGLFDEGALGDTLIDAVNALTAGGAREVVADVDGHRVAATAELERTGFRRLRSRIAFTPPSAG